MKWIQQGLTTVKFIVAKQRRADIMWIPDQKKEAGGQQGLFNHLPLQNKKPSFQALYHIFRLNLILALGKIKFCKYKLLTKTQVI